jgi:hypothetical protein
MFKRMKKATVVVAGLAALALGGSAIAGAASNGTPQPAKAPEAVSAVDNDTIQSGDQTTPDTASVASSASEPTAANEAAEPAGEQPEAPGSETGSEKVADDGPGGWADEAHGNANADTQQSGVN